MIPDNALRRFGDLITLTSPLAEEALKISELRPKVMAGLDPAIQRLN